MNQSKILIVIPARGQSKGIPRKNLRLMAGKPLISYAIDIAVRLKSIYNADVAVDTDDLEIASVGAVYGVAEVMLSESVTGDAGTMASVIYLSLIHTRRWRRRRWRELGRGADDS